MSTKERVVDRGSLRARSVLIDLGREIRQARLEHSLSQAVVGRAAKTSRSQVSRIERAVAPGASVLELARLLAVVGLELSARAYPAGPPLRDVAHLKLIARFRALVAPRVAWRFEVPIGIVGDPWAWDAVMLIEGIELGLEAETRPNDVQSLQRRLALKRCDDPGISNVVLLLANTPHNRNLVRDHAEALRADFPIPGEEILRALASGCDPRGSGVVLV